MLRKSSLPRRQCLKLVGAFSLGSLVPWSLYLNPAYAHKHLQKTTRTMAMMGTTVTITIYDPSREKATEMQSKAFQKMSELIPVFNRHDQQSHISSLNQNGLLNDVPPSLNTVVKACQILHNKTQKAFDISILPLLELYQRTLAKTGHPPSYSQVQKKKDLIGFDKVRLTSGKISFQRSGMQISLDGIAKGFIVDQAANLLKSHGIHYALINAGGDIRAIRGKGGSPWLIGLEDPYGGKGCIQKIGLTAMAVATSGNYENYYDPSGRHHHIIDTSQGDSPRRTISATAIAPSAMLADALSTTAFVFNPVKSNQLAKLFPKTETNVIVHGGRSYSSPGWNNFVL